MYTAAYVQAELDKLQTQSKFTKVLMLEKPKKKKPAQEEEEEGAESAGSSRSTRSSVPEPPPPTPLQRSENWVSNNPDIKMPPLYARQEKYKGGAGMYSLTNASELSRVGEYLFLNGQLEISPTPKDGACLYHAVRWGVDLPQEFVFQFLKRQIIMWMAENADYCLQELGETIQGVYGGSKDRENEPGPFSFLGFLKHHMDDSAWGDEIIVAALSRMWQITVTILMADSLIERRLRHNRPLSKVDLCLVFCGRNHFCGAGKIFHFYFLCRAVVRLWFKSVRLSSDIVRPTLDIARLYLLVVRLRRFGATYGCSSRKFGYSLIMYG